MQAEKLLQELEWIKT